MVYSGAWGKLIHEKNQKSKISWHCPFTTTGPCSYPPPPPRATDPSNQSEYQPGLSFLRSHYANLWMSWHLIPGLWALFWSKAVLPSPPPPLPAHFLVALLALIHKNFVLNGEIASKKTTFYRRGRENRAASVGLVTMVTATSALLTDTTRPSGHKVGQLDRHKVSQIGVCTVQNMGQIRTLWWDRSIYRRWFSFIHCK